MAKKKMTFGEYLRKHVSSTAASTDVTRYFRGRKFGGSYYQMAKRNGFDVMTRTVNGATKVYAYMIGRPDFAPVGSAQLRICTDSDADFT